MTIKLDGKLPAEADRNGLEALHRKLMAEPHQLRAVIMLVDRKSFEHADDENEDIPKARVRAIEAVTADDLNIARQLMDRAREVRLGRVQLPFGMEEEVRSAFAGASGVRARTVTADPGRLPDGPPPWVDAKHEGACTGCGDKIEAGDRIQADGSGGWLDEDCGTAPDGAL